MHSNVSYMSPLAQCGTSMPRTDSAYTQGGGIAACCNGVLCAKPVPGGAVRGRSAEAAPWSGIATHDMTAGGHVLYDISDLSGTHDCMCAVQPIHPLRSL